MGRYTCAVLWKISLPMRAFSPWPPIGRHLLNSSKKCKCFGNMTHRGLLGLLNVNRQTRLLSLQWCLAEFTSDVLCSMVLNVKVKSERTWLSSGCIEFGCLLLYGLKSQNRAGENLAFVAVIWNFMAFKKKLPGRNICIEPCFSKASYVLVFRRYSHSLRRKVRIRKKEKEKRNDRKDKRRMVPKRGKE